MKRLHYERGILMKSTEKNVLKTSDFFTYEPSLQARACFFYPVVTGHFIYEAGYCQQRSSYDSFLLMAIQKGQLIIETNGISYPVHEGQIVLIDCYAPHSYKSVTGWESLWLHFDGILSRNYYEMIIGNNGPVISLSDSYSFIRKLNIIYHFFRDNISIKEPLISKYINDILTELLLVNSSNSRLANYTSLIEDVISYITDHLSDDLSIETLSSYAHLSTYYFIRIFKKETGFTPHEYITNARISSAKYLLTTTQLSISEISYKLGFSCDSAFCTVFKGKTGSTPNSYRTTHVS